jgi:hypothetical protein
MFYHVQAIFKILTFPIFDCSTIPSFNPMDPLVQSMLLTVILRETKKVKSGLADELQQQS